MSPLLQEAKERLNRAFGGIETIDLGPVDYNVSTTTDDLLVAIRLLEAYGQEVRRHQINNNAA